MMSHNLAIERKPVANECKPVAMERKQAGEQRFRALFEEYRRPLYRFVLRSIGNAADAEDLAQQAFLEAYRGMGSFRGESELSTWLYGIAMNLVRNYLNRAPHRVRQYEPEGVLETLAGEADGPEELIERMELATRLYAQVESLSDDLKQIFLLIAIEGASYEEAAQRLSIPLGTVRSRLFRAREMLKVQLADLLQEAGAAARAGGE
jgi:RNA polymerase sigma factor (sigma-70 family)